MNYEDFVQQMIEGLEGPLSDRFGKMEIRIRDVRKLQNGFRDFTEQSTIFCIDILRDRIFISKFCFNTDVLTFCFSKSSTFVLIAFKIFSLSFLAIYQIQRYIFTLFYLLNFLLNTTKSI